MEQCAMTPGITQTLQWSANNWDFLHMVSTTPYFSSECTVIVTKCLSCILPFSFAGAIGGGETFGDRHDNSLVTSIACMGNESKLLNCPHDQSGHECGILKDAHVVCQGLCILSYIA